MTTPETVEKVYKKLLRLTHHKNWNVRQMTAFAVSLTIQHIPPVSANLTTRKRLSVLNLYDLAARPQLLAEAPDSPLPAKMADADNDIHGII